MKSTKPLKTAIVFILISLSLQGFSQNKSYEITNLNGQNLTIYSQAIENANWDKYRLPDKRRILHFENGLTFELLSEKELKAKNIAYKINRINRYADATIEYPYEFTLGENGYIIEQKRYYSKTMKN